MSDSGGYRKHPRGSDDFSWQTHKQTLHHNIYISPSTCRPLTITCRAILSETKAVKVGGGRASKAAFVGANNVIGPGWEFNCQMKMWQVEKIVKNWMSPVYLNWRVWLFAIKDLLWKALLWIWFLLLLLTQAFLRKLIHLWEKVNETSGLDQWDEGAEVRVKHLLVIGSSCFQVNYFVEF